MKITKKLIIAAGIILQSAGLIYAGPWEDAALLFGGGSDILLATKNVLNGPKSIVAAQALSVAKKARSDESMAIAAYVSAPSKNKSDFFRNNKLSDNDVVNALRSIIADAQARAIENQPVVEPTVQQPAPSTGWGWFGGSSAATTPTITPANVQAAVKEQQQADLALAAANNDAIAKIISSGKSGVSLYTAFIDYIFSVLQQAVNSIADAKTQQQVLSYMQGKFANMKASVAANNYRSNTLGRMNSKIVKKSSKKDKHKNL